MKKRKGNDAWNCSKTALPVVLTMKEKEVKNVQTYET